MKRKRSEFDYYNGDKSHEIKKQKIADPKKGYKNIYPEVPQFVDSPPNININNQNNGDEEIGLIPNFDLNLNIGNNNNNNNMINDLELEPSAPLATTEVVPPPNNVQTFPIYSYSHSPSIAPHPPQIQKEEEEEKKNYFVKPVYTISNNDYQNYQISSDVKKTNNYVYPRNSTSQIKINNFKKRTPKVLCDIKQGNSFINEKYSSYFFKKDRDNFLYKDIFYQKHSTIIFSILFVCFSSFFFINVFLSILTKIFLGTSFAFFFPTVVFLILTLTRRKIRILFDIDKKVLVIETKKIFLNNFCECCIQEKIREIRLENIRTFDIEKGNFLKKLLNTSLKFEAVLHNNERREIIVIDEKFDLYSYKDSFNEYLTFLRQNQIL